MTSTQQTPAMASTFARIDRVMNAMPFGATRETWAAHNRYRLAIRDGADDATKLQRIEDYLTALAGELRDHGNRHNTLEANHHQLQADVAAMGRVLDIDGLKAKITGLAGTER